MTLNIDHTEILRKTTEAAQAIAEAKTGHGEELKMPAASQAEVEVTRIIEMIPGMIQTAAAKGEHSVTIYEAPNYPGTLPTMVFERLSERLKAELPAGFTTSEWGIAGVFSIAVKW